MSSRDGIEFYCDDDMIASVASSMGLIVGSLISIRGQVYKISVVNFAVDHADKFSECRMRCNVELEKI